MVLKAGLQHGSLSGIQATGGVQKVGQKVRKEGLEVNTGHMEDADHDFLSQ